MWDHSQIYCDNIVNWEKVPIYGQFGPKGKKIESFESYESRIIVIEEKYIIRKSYVDLVGAQSTYALQIKLGKHRSKLLMSKVHKQYLYKVTFMTLGVEA